MPSVSRMKFGRISEEPIISSVMHYSLRIRVIYPYRILKNEIFSHNKYYAPYIYIPFRERSLPLINTESG